MGRRPVVIPELLACPRCGLSIQAGKNPDGLAFHECRPRAKVHNAIALLLETAGFLSEEQVRDVALRAALAAAAEDPSGPVMLELYRTLTPKPDGRVMGRPKKDAGGPSKGLASWLTADPLVAEEDP